MAATGACIFSIAELGLCLFVKKTPLVTSLVGIFSCSKYNIPSLWSHSCYRDDEQNVQFVTFPIQFSIEYCIQVSSSKSGISLPKVIIILDTTKPLSFKTLIVCLHLCCSWGAAGIVLLEAWLEKQHPLAILHAGALEQPRALVWSRRDISCRVHCWERGFPWPGEGLCREAPTPLPLLLSPACPRQVVLLLPLHLPGSRTKALVIYYT